MSVRLERCTIQIVLKHIGVLQQLVKIVAYLAFVAMAQNRRANGRGLLFGEASQIGHNLLSLGGAQRIIVPE
jgi:hypothetical protein